MKLTVVGYWGAYPERNDATSSYLLQDWNTNILLDCGSGAVAELQNYIPLANLDAVILTHYHHDHIADIGVLQYSRIVDMNLNNTDQPLKIYGHQEDPQVFMQLGKKPFTEAIPYTKQTKVTIGTITFTFHPTTHPVPCFAIKATSTTGKTIVYTGDTTYDEALLPFIDSTDLLITETSFYEDQEAHKFGHMNSKEAGTLAKKGNVKKLLLSHLPHFGAHQQLKEESKKYFTGEVKIATSGLSFTL